MQRPVPNNRAEQHVIRLKKRLGKNPELLNDYKGFVQDIVTKGYAQKVPEHSKESDCEGNSWFIPHHGVYHPHKPGKIRVVFDCSARFKGSSLNDLLMKGPDLTNSLLGVLTIFRQDHVAVMADIQEMFHQVRVPECDRSFLRFERRFITWINRISDDRASIWSCVFTSLLQLCPPENSR